MEMIFKIKRINSNEYEPIAVDVDKYVVNTFKNDETIEEVIVPEGVKVINGLFYGCKNLKIVKLPETLEKIGDETFKKCKKLEEITIPNSVNTIGTYAFHHCTRLKKVVITNENLKFNSTTFQDTSTLLTNKYGTYEYMGTLEKPYLWMVKSHSFSNDDIHKDCKHILCGFFSQYLEKLTIPDNVETISILGYCGAKHLILGSGLRKIDSSCFEHCENLNELTIYSKNLVFKGEPYGLHNLTLNIYKEEYEINKDFFVSERIKTINYL